MKKTTKFLLGGVLGILLLIPVSQAKADWHQEPLFSEYHQPTLS